MNIGESIRQQRKEHNYTQQKLAEELLISRTTISSWENGRTYPDLSMLIKLSDIFCVSVDSLLKGDFEMVNALDKNVKSGRKAKYYLIALIILLMIIVSYFSMISLKKNTLYSNVNDWEKIGGFYTYNEHDITYMTAYSDSLDIRSIPNQLSLLADISNDNNSQITMVYDGNDSNIQISFRSGPIEGMSFVFNSEDFILNETSESNNKYSYEIMKSVNTQLNKEHSYLKETFFKVKNKWKEINL